MLCTNSQHVAELTDVCHVIWGARKNVGPLLNEVGALAIKDTGKVELLNATFASVFTTNTNPQESQTMELRARVWRKEDLLLVDEDIVRLFRLIQHTQSHRP